MSWGDDSREWPEPVEYTPTTQEIRICYVGYDGPNDAFDRWLAAHDAEVRASVVAEEPEWEYAVRDSKGRIFFTATVGARPGDVRVRRRKAEWEVVTDA